MTSKPMATAVEFRVRYSETDQMGVVYHAHYFVWCEVARTELIRQRFIPYAELEKRGVLLAVAEASIRYHAAAHYDDLIRVDAWLRDVRSRMITFDYLVSRVDLGTANERLATVTTTLVVLGSDSRPRKLPVDLMEALSHV